MSTIPASQLVSVAPSVISAGGTGLDIIGLILTTNSRVPLGANGVPTVSSFSTQAAVSSFFGPASQEAALAANYFAGFVGANKVPGSVLFAQYPSSAVAAYLRGGNISTLTLSQLQAISGSLNVTVDGIARDASAVNLSGATSFSNAAATIATALNAGGANPTIASFTASITGTVMTVTGSPAGTIAAGQQVNGSGVTAGTYITSLGTGTGGAGTYNVSVSQTVVSEAMTTNGVNVAVTYDSVSGAFVITSGITGLVSTVAFATGTIAAALLLTSATGAVLSQGAAAATPAAFMNALITVTMNWATFMTAFDPDGGSGNTVKQAFAAWKGTVVPSNRFGYVAWDTDASPTVSVPAASSLGQILEANNDSGTFLLDGDAASGWTATTAAELAAFVCGAAASIDFTQQNGRITFAYKAQADLTGTVTTATIATNLGDNFYNFYGAYGAANENFTFLQDGQCTGPFEWFDSFINQIWLNNQFQIALLTLLANSKSIPYSNAGNALIRGALSSVIQAGLNFGAFAPGTISAAEAAEVNAQAGTSISDALQAQGSYLQILVASSTVRAQRGSPPMTFWYLDRGSIQRLNLASVATQ